MLTWNVAFVPHGSRFPGGLLQDVLAIRPAKAGGHFQPYLVLQHHLHPHADDPVSTDCPSPLQFFEGLECAQLDPPCGNPGACCDDGTGICTIELQANCTGRFIAAQRPVRPHRSTSFRDW